MAVTGTHQDFPGPDDFNATFDIAEVGIKKALENSALVYSLSEPAIQCKSSADAFFGLLHLHFVCFDDHERSIDKLIQSAKKPELFDVKCQELWHQLQMLCTTFEEHGQSLTTTKKFIMIRSSAFLKRTTISSTADIDLMVRTQRQKRMTREFDHAEGMPLVVVTLVAEIIGSEMLDFVKVVFRPNMGGGGGVEVDKARKNLSSMALVHRTWTQPAQAVLKRRVVLKSWLGARRFLTSPFCGPWIRELVFNPPWMEVDQSQDDDGDDDIPSGPPQAFCRPTLKNPWPLVCKLLACTPNLRLLAISLIYRTTIQNLSMIDYKAASPFAELLGGLRSLEGLEIRSLSLHDVAPDRLFFTDLCKNLAKLRNLRRLGFHGFQSMDLFPIRCKAVPAPLPPVDFAEATPPPLQRLVLHFSDEPLNQDSAAHLWLLGCSDTLEELFMHFSIPDEDHIQQRFVRRMLRIFTPNLVFQNLRRLKFVFIDDYEAPYFKGAFGKLCLAFVKNCVRLTHLHLTFSGMPKLELPESLESLTLSFDWDHSLGSDPQRFAKWASKALKLVETNKLPKLKKVVIEMHCREPFAGIPKGLQMLELVFKGLVSWGRTNRVSVEFEDERNHDSRFDSRLDDFVFGQSH